MFGFRGDPAWLIEHPIAGHGDGRTYGAARVPGLLPSDRSLSVIFSSPGGDAVGPGWDWEHVSVTATGGTPTWAEMVRIKSLFWDDEDRVVQFHPPKSEYVNRHTGCLHLWRWTGGEFPSPPRVLVG